MLFVYFPNLLVCLHVLFRLVGYIHVNCLFKFGLFDCRAERRGNYLCCVLFCRIYVRVCIFVYIQSSRTPWLHNCLFLPKHQGQLFLVSVRIKSVSNVVQSTHYAYLSSSAASCSCNSFAILNVGILTSLPRPRPSLSGICLHAWCLLCAYEFRLLRNVMLWKRGTAWQQTNSSATPQLCRGGRGGGD